MDRCDSTTQPACFVYRCSLEAGHDGLHLCVIGGQVEEVWHDDGTRLRKYLVPPVQHRDLGPQRRIKERRRAPAEEDRRLSAGHITKSDPRSHHVLHPGAWMLHAHVDIPAEREEILPYEQRIRDLPPEELLPWERGTILKEEWHGA